MKSKFKWILTLLIALSMQFSFAQEKTVSGVVSDAVQSWCERFVKGTNRSIQTDFDGKYTKVKVGEVLLLYIGMKEASVPLVANTVNVKLVTSSQTLKVVVVGYGTQKKRPY
jgi:hypothetical protein